MAENAVMEAAGGIFSRKYAGIPFPIILGGVGIVAFGVRKFTKGKQDAAAVAASDPATEGYAMDVSGNKFASAYTGEAGGVPFGSGVGNSGYQGNGVTQPDPPTETDNSGWARRVAEKLMSGNMWDPILVQNALTKYLSGRTLDQREQAIINQGIKMEGQPIIIPDSTTSKPATPVKVPPVAKGVANITYFVQDTKTGHVWARYSDGRWVSSNNPADTIRMRSTVKDWKAKTVHLAPSDPVIKDLWKRFPYVNPNQITYLKK